MKYTSYVILIITLFLSGCGKRTDSITNNLLNEAGRLIDSHPDSAYGILTVINQTDSLDNENFSRWCLLYCTLSKKIPLSLLSTDKVERAAAWYNKYGGQEDRLQMGLFLGEVYVHDGEMKKAMSIYTEICHEAQQHCLYNTLGYAYSYIGELYEVQNYMSQSAENFKYAADNFKKAGNTRSYVCALRDLGREYVFMDSIAIASKLIKRADSIAQTINDNEVRGSTLNALGNICLIKEEYNQAENYFLEALSITKDTLPNYFALIDLYMQQDSLLKAKTLLQKLPHDNPRYLYSIKEAYYNIHKNEGDYLQALQYLEECVYINDSIILADNEAKVAELEKRYNHLKLQKESADLRLSRQKYRIIVVLCITVILFILLVSFLYKRKAENKIHKQQMELGEIKSNILQLSLESERRKEQLDISKSEIEKSRQIQQEIKMLKVKYQRLRICILTNSAIYKKLRQLLKQNIPGNNKVLLTEEHWRLITEQIKTVYSGLECFVLERYPNISQQQWRYCCLYMFCLDSNEEARLLNITPTSARTKRSRLRQNLNIELSDEDSLYEYFVSNIY